MFIRAAIAALLLAAFPAAGMAQDAAATVQALRQSLGKAWPRTLTISATGSGYAAANGENDRRHFRIESYTQELDLVAMTASEKVAPQDVGPLESQYAYWLSPFGFVSAAGSTQATVGTEKLFGRDYTVLTVAAGNGQQVKGYLDQNVLERARMEVAGPQGKVTLEAIYHQWTEFNGVRVPTLVIQKENDELARILVVNKVEHTPAAQSTAAR